MEQCNEIPPGWRDIVENAGTSAMQAAAACAGPCIVSFEFERVGGRLMMTWGCQPAPRPLLRRMVAICSDAHLRSAITCESCGEPGRRIGGRTSCGRHRENT